MHLALASMPAHGALTLASKIRPLARCVTRIQRMVNGRLVLARGEDRITVVLVIPRDEHGQMLRWDRITRTGPARLIRGINFREVLEQDPPTREQRRMSFESTVIGWKVGLSSTADRPQVCDVEYARQARNEASSSKSQ